MRQDQITGREVHRLVVVEMTRAVAVVAGGCAVASGLAYLVYFASGGGSEWAITGWNLLIIPAALVLGVWLASRGSLIAAGATVAGVAASVLWAFDFRRAAVEPWWIALAAAWWLGLGWVLRQHHRRTASLTFALGMAAAIDLVVTLGDAPLPWLAVGGLKLPLATVWSIWVGVLLIRSWLDGGWSGADGQRRHRTPAERPTATLPAPASALGIAIVPRKGRRRAMREHWPAP